MDVLTIKTTQGLQQYKLAFQCRVDSSHIKKFDGGKIFTVCHTHNCMHMMLIVAVTL